MYCNTLQCNVRFLKIRHNAVQKAHYDVKWWDEFMSLYFRVSWFCFSLRHAGARSMDGKPYRDCRCGRRFPWSQEGGTPLSCFSLRCFKLYQTLLNMFCFFLWTLSVSNKHWQVKWVEGVFEKESKSSDFPTIILDTSHLEKSLEWLAFLLSFWNLLILEVMTEGLEQDFFGLALLPQRGSLSVQLFLVPISKLFELLRLPLGRSCLQFGVWSAKAGFAGLTFKGSEFWRFIIVYFWVWLTSGRW